MAPVLHGLIIPEVKQLMYPARIIPQNMRICAPEKAVSPIPAHGLTVTCHSHLDQIEPVWRKLVHNGAHCSRYQHIDWAGCWFESFRTRSSLELSVLLCTTSTDQPVMLLPLVTRQIGPLHIATFMGGSHANFNLPVWTDHPAVRDRGFAPQLIRELRRQLSIDVLVLLNQPQIWDGVANPLACLPHSSGCNQGHGGELESNFDDLLGRRMGRSSRRKLRQKAKRLEELGPVSCWRAEGPDEIRKVLDAFFAQKHKRMRELGGANVFAEPATRHFIEAAAHRIDAVTGRPVIELYAMTVGDDIIATFGGIVADGRFSGMFNSMADGAYRDYSPGEQLLVKLVEQCCQRGLRYFDLGIGYASYKKTFCHETVGLMDSVVPLSRKGQLATQAIRAGLALKRTIKQSDRAMTFYHRLGTLMSSGRSA